jgi:hypothetical protein
MEFCIHSPIRLHGRTDMKAVRQFEKSIRMCGIQGVTSQKTSQFSDFDIE